MSRPTVDLVDEAVETLNDGAVVIDPKWDYLIADVLEILAAIHRETGIDLELVQQVRTLAQEIVEARG